MGKFAPSSIVPASLRQRYDVATPLQKRPFSRPENSVGAVHRRAQASGSRVTGQATLPNADDNRAALDSLYAKLAAANIALQKVFPVTSQRIDPSAGPRRAFRQSSVVSDG
jgi:hypothetical protein